MSANIAFSTGFNDFHHVIQNIYIFDISINSWSFTFKGF